MSFRFETDLVDVLKHTLRRVYGGENLEMLEEVSLGYGIADIVLCYIDSSLTTDAHEQILTHMDVNIYNIISKQQHASFETLISITRSSKKSIYTSIRKLIDLGYIRETNDGYSIQNEYRFQCKRTFAIEAKLKDWKRAINQAKRYHWFADYSYVVLDEKHSNSAQMNINTFKKYNIGLATINTNGRVNRIFNPKRQKPFDPIMPILLSEKIKMSLEA